MTVFRLDFKRNFGGLIAATIVISVIAVLLMVFHKVFAGAFQPVSFEAKVNALPSLIRGILGLSAVPDLSGAFAFAAYAFQFVLLLAGLYAGIIGAKALSGEEGKGSIEFLYSLPVTRGSILRQKVASGIVRYLIFSIVVYAVTCCAIWFLNKDMHISGVVIQMIRVFICIVFAGLVYMAIGYLVSALFRSNADSVSVMIAIVLITYIVGMMGNIMPHLFFLRYFSPIHAELPLTVLNKGFGFIGLVIGLAVFIAALLLASLRYRKKDFLV